MTLVRKAEASGDEVDRGTNRAVDQGPGPDSTKVQHGPRTGGWIAPDGGKCEASAHELMEPGSPTGGSQGPEA